MDIHELTNGLCSLFTWICTNKQMVYEVCLHGYTRINKWFLFTWIYTNKQMGYNSLFTWIYTNKQMVYVGFVYMVYIYTNKQMVYEVCLHGYARINKWFMRFVYMDIHE